MLTVLRATDPFGLSDSAPGAPGAHRRQSGRPLLRIGETTMVWTTLADGPGPVSQAPGRCHSPSPYSVVEQEDRVGAVSKVQSIEAVGAGQRRASERVAARFGGSTFFEEDAASPPPPTGTGPYL